ncbi:MAG: F0F1 ATP synthase subunit A, partial [Flavobacteriales bacterium]|nr:F0F1 ATP synthase subunit A [Flavobacteriales bacterium]
HGPATHNGYGIHHDHIFVADEAGHEDEEATAKIIDLSLTKNATALIITSILLLWLMFSAAKAYKKRPGQAPRGLQNAMEVIITFVRDDVAKAMIGEKKYEKFLPFLLTVFFFIWINNIMGLVPIFPGGANVTGNVAVPAVLAFFTFIITNINGNKHYWRHTFAMPGIPIPILLILTPIEIMQIFIRPVVLMIRLFANIMAGHIGMLVFFSLIFIFSKNGESIVGGYATAPFSVAFTIFLYFLELLVGAIQAYVFTLLSAIYIGMAVADDHH